MVKFLFETAPRCRGAEVARAMPLKQRRSAWRLAKGSEERHAAALLKWHVPRCHAAEAAHAVLPQPVSQRVKAGLRVLALESPLAISALVDQSLSDEVMRPSGFPG